ncbi:MAG: 3-hydroxyacyl-(acyl-carrier-protein) dehydratase FabZ [Planctomycetes bacterium ADurb.Bin412]|nr:MAG: 3-hydroxyacyl-(acyl-carrier-protein) dehydratase FabZ [Planctomycetes bacterium ADurb.Bin412]
MRFILLDKVTELVPGKKISTVKALSLAEEYLADHFPQFPVLPGVLMIEALVQSAAMLVHVTQNFAHSMVVLQEARNVKYKSFVKPGNILQINLEAKSISQDSSSFVGEAHIEGQPMVEARIKLRHFNLQETDKGLADLDARIIKELQRRAQLVGACGKVSGGTIL